MTQQPEREIDPVSLPESKQMLETLMGNLPGMAYRCRLDEAWTMEFVSEGTRALTGYTAEEICQNRVVSFDSLIHQDDRQRVRRDIMRAVEQDQQFQVSYRIQTRQGAEKWVWEQGCAVQRKGRPFLEGFITDISEIKRMEAVAQTNAARANALLIAASRLNAQLDLKTVLDTVCEEAVRANNAFASAIFLYEHDERAFMPRAAHGIPPARLNQFKPISRETFDHYVKRFDFPRYMPDLLTNQDVANREFYEEAGIRSAAIAHVKRNGSLIGLLITYFDHAQPGLPQERLDLLQGFSDLAAQAISNARYHGQARRRLRRLQALRAIDGAILGRRDLDDALHVVVQQVKEQLDVDAVAIFLLDARNRQLRFSAGSGFRNASLEHATFAIGEGIIGRAAQEGRLQVDLAQSHEYVVESFLKNESFAAYIGVKLSAEESLSGVLALFHRQPLALNEEEMAFLESIAMQSAIAIDNANLLSETQRLLQRTQLQANQIRQIVDSMPEGVVLLDRHGRVVLANPIGADYLHTLGAVVGDNLTHLGGTALESLLATASTQTGWQEIRTEQLQKTFEVAFEPLRQGPRSGGWVMVLIETTEERERQKRQQMQERLATVGQLAAGIAHDFNNILGVITLYTEMLLATLDLDESQHEKLTVVYQQAQQASALIRQILDFSRQSVIERRPVELKTFVKEVVQLLDRTLPENIQVELFMDEQRSYIVSADLTRLQQVLINLAVNARDAMPDGGRLHVSMRTAKFGEEDVPVPDMAPGNWVVLSIADTGHGIREADQTRIFEPFFSTKARGEGTGLGLAQVYGIVQQHEGFVDVKSTIEKGSVFTVYLPTPITYATAVEHVSEAHLPQGSGETILVVEDNPVIQQALQEILLLLNYHVLLAGDGEQALQLLDQHAGEVSLVVSDLVMPRLGGAGLYGKLRDRFPEIGMVVMTGYPLEMQSRELLEYSDLHWVQKPFAVETIAETVSRAIRGDATPPESA